MKRTSFLAAMAAALILTWGGAAEAQEPALDLSGGYGLEGRSRFGGEVVRTNLRLGRRPTGLYHVLRTSYGEDGERLPVLQGSGRQVGDGMVFVTFDAPEGALQKLWQVISGAERPELESYHGLYVFRDGRVVGTLQAPNADGRRRIYEERGTWDRPAPALEASAAPAAETAPSAPGLPALSGQGLIEQPYDGDAHLAGSELPLVAAPGAHVAVEGPAERTDRGLRLTGPGQVWLRARGPDGARHTVRIASVAPELVGLQVVDALPVDGAEPGFERELGGATPAVAAVLKVGRPLRLAVRLAAPRSLSSPATVVLAARAGERTLLEQEVRLADLAAGAGQVVRLSGAAPFAEAIGAHGLEVRWTLGEREVAVTPLRLYVALGAPAGEPPTPDLPGARPTGTSSITPPPAPRPRAPRRPRRPPSS